MNDKIQTLRDGWESALDDVEAAQIRMDGIRDQLRDAEAAYSKALIRESEAQNLYERAKREEVA